MGCCCCWSFMYKKSIYLSSGLQSTFVELFSKRSHWLLRSLQHLTYKLGRLTLQSHYIRFIEWRSFWSNRFALWQVTHTKSFIPNCWINNQSKFIYLSLSNEYKIKVLGPYNRQIKIGVQFRQHLHNLTSLLASWASPTFIHTPKAFDCL